MIKKIGQRSSNGRERNLVKRAQEIILIWVWEVANATKRRVQSIFRATGTNLTKHIIFSK